MITTSISGNKILSHFKSVDPIIYQQLSRMDLKPLIPLAPPSGYFRNLCHEIIGQQLAGQAARAIVTRFENLFSSRPTPKQVLSLTESDLRAVGLSWAKARSIIDLAGKVKNREVDLASLFQADDEAVITELVRVRGIGRWTAEMFLIFTLGRQDVFSFGDLGLKKGFKLLYRLNDQNLDVKMKKLTGRWSPFRSYGSLALWHSLE